MFASMRKALQIIFDPAFFSVAVKSVLLSLLLFGVLFAGTEYGQAHLPTLGWHWINVALEWLAPVLFVLLMVVLGAPVAAIFGSLFLDEIAEAVEAQYYPADPKASGVPFFTGLLVGMRLAFWILLLSLVLLPFHILLPLAGTALALLVDGWLLGREFFELAALRHMSLTAADNMRKRHAFGVLGAGLIISLMAAIPVVNVIAPLFGAAFMAHEFKRYEHQERNP
jgi:CysZ protein